MTATTTEPTTEAPAGGAPDSFRHEALLYKGDDSFVDATVPFLREAVAREEPALVVVSRTKVALLQSALGAEAGAVWFADMAEVGQNPARINPAWRSFLDEQGTVGRPVRGISEPIWAARNAAELMECQRQESWLNTAFGGGYDFWLLCSYDTATLSESVIERARRDHPVVFVDGVHQHSPSWCPESSREALSAEKLSEPGRELAELTFKAGLLGVMREVVAVHATRFGMCPTRAHDLVVAVNEVATNSVVHGGGGGVFRMWREGKVLVCEIADHGCIGNPPAGWVAPRPDSVAGRGLWLTNQLCDLVQIRLQRTGSVVRLHMNIDLDQ